MARDPIINKAASASASTKNASQGRIKSISGGAPNYSKVGQSCGSPAPNSPYGKK